MTRQHDRYESPLAGRYASREMVELFSPLRRIRTWRRLWIELAKAERELGLPIPEAAVREMEAHAADVNFETADAKEKEVRHDVMAHVHAFGEQAPAARPWIHLGATSCYVTDNADLLLARDALSLVARRLAAAIERLASFAKQHRDTATLAFTHFQPAQCTTVGKRATLWIQDLALDLEEVSRLIAWLPLLGAKGTTGTQASFLRLFDGDHAKVKELERRIAKALGFERSIAVSGQTYTRKIDWRIVSTLAGIAASCSKMSVDLRLLQHRREVEEPFEKEQIGSSAMPYKRNPMRSERITGLSRFVISIADSAAQTAATQWLERTLDDSANRRLTLPEAFLATEACLILVADVSAGLVVNRRVIDRALRDELPFMASEDVLMEATKRGGDRQDLHERIRKHSVEVMRAVREEGARNDLLDRLAKDPAFAKVAKDLPSLADPRAFVGRSPQQVDEFLAEVVEPALAPWRGKLGEAPKVEV
ncbi:MAG TPA: adenylosuccinate lyase [Planctomycetota bacterium]|nr:adenylosuccinate lyase [Planctomycetota bacterium]